MLFAGDESKVKKLSLELCMPVELHGESSIKLDGSNVACSRHLDGNRPITKSQPDKVEETRDDPLSDSASAASQHCDVPLVVRQGKARLKWPAYEIRWIKKKIQDAGLTIARPDIRKIYTADQSVKRFVDAKYLDTLDMKVKVRRIAQLLKLHWN